MFRRLKRAHMYIYIDTHTHIRGQIYSQIDGKNRPSRLAHTQINSHACTRLAELTRAQPALQPPWLASLSRYVFTVFARLAGAAKRARARLARQRQDPLCSCAPKPESGKSGPLTCPARQGEQVSATSWGAGSRAGALVVVSDERRELAGRNSAPPATSTPAALSATFRSASPGGQLTLGLASRAPA